LVCAGCGGSIKEAIVDLVLITLVDVLDFRADPPLESLLLAADYLLGPILLVFFTPLLSN